MWVDITWMASKVYKMEQNNKAITSKHYDYSCSRAQFIAVRDSSQNGQYIITDYATSWPDLDKFVTFKEVCYITVIQVLMTVGTVQTIIQWFLQDKSYFANCLKK